MTSPRILGITEDSNGGCEHCGRQNLKRYVAVQHEGGHVGYYGTTCGPAVYGREVWAALNLALADEAVAATPGAAELLNFIRLCRPGRITTKFRGEVADRYFGPAADRDAAVDAAIAAYKAG